MGWERTAGRRGKEEFGEEEASKREWGGRACGKR